ncbi:hypothetical protein SAMN05421504_103338 [Amycolatopsis xylanica]|uniref:Uncharacterized protein n=1 Tax=Amycolatopsis xylanica TaxID=589385 RepID=A0A1H3DEL1_9PSEU|nr:hypothetical protein SAMN05421504_103338 [Amycolatopsis xylanica]
MRLHMPPSLLAKLCFAAFLAGALVSKLLSIAY